MASPLLPPRPRSLAIVAIAALAWSLIGVAMFVMQVSLGPDDLAAMPEARRSIYEASPAALDVAFGIAVFAGVLGAIGLWMRRHWAVALLLVSLLAVAAQMLMAYAMTPAWRVLGPSGAVLPVVLVVVAFGLWWYARRARALGWLGGRVAR